MPQKYNSKHILKEELLKLEAISYLQTQFPILIFQRIVIFLAMPNFHCSHISVTFILGSFMIFMTFPQSFMTFYNFFIFSPFFMTFKNFMTNGSSFLGIVHKNTSQIISSITQWRSSIGSHGFLNVRNCFQTKRIKILNYVNEYKH